MIISGLEILEERRTDEGLALVGKCGNELDLFWDMETGLAAK